MTSPLEWVRRARSAHDATGPARAVLFVLASYASPEGVCWPSQPTIARDAGVSERTVRTALRTLTERSYLRALATPAGGSITWQLCVAEDGAATHAQHPTPAGDAGVAQADTPAGGAAPPGRRCRPPRQEVPPPPAGAADEVSMEGVSEESTEESTPPKPPTGGERVPLPLSLQPPPDGYRSPPAWVARKRRGRRRVPPDWLTDDVLYALCRAAVDAVRRRPEVDLAGFPPGDGPGLDAAYPDVSEAVARPAWALLDEMGWPAPSEALRGCRLLAWAAKHGQHEMFVRHIRGVGWPGKADSSSEPASVYRLAAPEGSTGPSWESRLRQAESEAREATEAARRHARAVDQAERSAAAWGETFAAWRSVVEDLVVLNGASDHGADGRDLHREPGEHARRHLALQRVLEAASQHMGIEPDDLESLDAAGRYYWPALYDDLPARVPLRVVGEASP